MRQLELRRHAKRDPQEDRLSAEGRAQAEDVGRTLAGGYAVVYTSPTQRAAETVAWFFRGRGEQLPPEHAVVSGLVGETDDDRTPTALAKVVARLMADVPQGDRGLAVGHTPLIEKAILGLTGIQIAPLAECEGVLVTERDDGTLELEEIRSTT